MLRDAMNPHTQTGWCMLDAIPFPPVDWVVTYCILSDYADRFDPKALRFYRDNLSRDSAGPE